MNAYRAKPLNFPWPPFIYGAAVLIALALARLVPIPVAKGHGWFPWLIGAALIVLAISLDLWAVKSLLDRRTGVPHVSSPAGRFASPATRSISAIRC